MPTKKLTNKFINYLMFVLINFYLIILFTLGIYDVITLSTINENFKKFLGKIFFTIRTL